MFKGYDPDKRPPYEQVIYYLIGEKIMKTTYIVMRGYADSISVTSHSKQVESIPSGSQVEVAK